MRIGGKTIGDMKRILEDIPDDKMIWLEGFDFHVCKADDGTIDLYGGNCPYYMKEVV